MTPVTIPKQRRLTSYYLATPAAVGIARKAVELTAIIWGYTEDRVDAVRLVASELVTNAVENAPRGEIQVTISEYADNRLLVEVRDESPDLPRKMRAGPLAEKGRGLWVVEKVSSFCGVRWEHGRKVVFAVI